MVGNRAIVGFPADAGVAAAAGAAAATGGVPAGWNRASATGEGRSVPLGVLPLYIRPDASPPPPLPGWRCCCWLSMNAGSGEGLGKCGGAGIEGRPADEGYGARVREGLPSDEGPASARACFR